MRKAELTRRLKIAEEEIDELRTQLCNNLVEREVPDTRYPRGIIAVDGFGISHMYDQPTKKVHELTTEGKINAILEHLGLDVTVEQRKTTTTGPKIKTVKVKKGKK